MSAQLIDYKQNFCVGYIKSVVCIFLCTYSIKAHKYIMYKNKYILLIS